MPLPIPKQGLVVPDFSSDRGRIIVDVVTKSVITKATRFIMNNVCDAPAYIKFSSSVSVNQNTEDCDNVLAGTMSISGMIPFGPDGEQRSGDYFILEQLVRDQILSSFGEIP